MFIFNTKKKHDQKSNVKTGTLGNYVCLAWGHNYFRDQNAEC